MQDLQERIYDADEGILWQVDRATMRTLVGHYQDGGDHEGAREFLWELQRLGEVRYLVECSAPLLKQ